MNILKCQRFKELVFFGGKAEIFDLIIKKALKINAYFTGF